MSKLARIYLLVALGVILLLVGGGVFLLNQSSQPLPVPLARQSQQEPGSPQDRKLRAIARQAEEEGAAQALRAAGESGRVGGSLSVPEPAPIARLKPWKETRSLPGGISARLKSFPDSGYLVCQLELTGSRETLDALRRSKGYLLIELQDDSGKKALELKVRKKALAADPGKGGRLLVSPLVAAACSDDVAARASTWQIVNH